MIITGIGSRETPQNILAEMQKIGVHCKRNKVFVRSGHADGADYAFECGAQEYCIVYIPWRTFNSQLTMFGKPVVVHYTDKIRETVYKHHPRPDTLSFAVQKIMGRNAAQVLSEFLNVPSDYVVCWTKDGRDSGGTGQAIRIATANKIPVINMYHEKYNTAQKVIDSLKG
jgi:hypothetical protein